MDSNSLKLSLQNKIKPYSKCFSNLSQQNMITILKNCILHIENQNYFKEVNELELQKMAIDSETYYEIFTAIYSIMTTIFKYKNGGDVGSILKDLQFSTERTRDLLKFIEHQKDSLSKRYIEIKLKQTSINRHSYQYRINMGSQLYITLQLQNKGTLKTFQLSLRQFQRLRLVVAKILSEIQILEK